MKEILSARINISLVDEKSKTPEFSRAGDACMDCYARTDVTIPGFDINTGLGRGLVPLGFRLALPQGWEAQIRPRSGLALKEGLTILNSPGTIDENYRGEVGAIVVNTTVKPYSVKQGDRICQLAIRPIYDVSRPACSCGIIWNVVEELDETVRGEDGFGSSGKKLKK